MNATITPEMIRSAIINFAKSLQPAAVNTESDFVELSETAEGRPTYIFVGRNQINKEDVCWYSLGDTGAVKLPSNSLVGKIVSFEIKDVVRGKRGEFKSTKLLTSFVGRSGKRYVLESGWDAGKAAICSKGIMTSIITLGDIDQEVTLSVKPAPDSDKVVFLNFSTAEGSVFPTKGLSSLPQDTLLARVEALGVSVTHTGATAPEAAAPDAVYEDIPF